ncbi:MAG: hypothetical protein QNJ98_18425 [Planctomycetota bacterium]|nr:hypothetical protein [Planctomycetota bacterium]
MSDREAYVADKIRKAATFVISAAGTYFLLRVLYRTAEGTQQLVDVELFAFLALTVLAIWWVRSTRRVRRTPREREQNTADESGD